MFHNGNFRYLENFLQRKRKTRRTRERVFRASRDKSFESFSGCGFQGCTGLPKETLNMLIYIYIYIHIHIYIYIYIYIYTCYSIHTIRNSSNKPLLLFSLCYYNRYLERSFQVLFLNAWYISFG